MTSPTGKTCCASCRSSSTSATCPRTKQGAREVRLSPKAVSLQAAVSLGRRQLGPLRIRRSIEWLACAVAKTPRGGAKQGGSQRRSSAAAPGRVRARTRGNPWAIRKPDSSLRNHDPEHNGPATPRRRIDSRHPLFLEARQTGHCRVLAERRQRFRCGAAVGRRLDVSRRGGRSARSVPAWDRGFTVGRRLRGNA